MLVAQAEPTAPSGSSPIWPHTSAQASAALTRLPITMATMPGSGRLMPSRKKPVVM